MKLRLNHYGLHWLEGNIGLLVQEDSVDHVLGVQMDFDVKVNVGRKMFCPHNINLNDVVEPDLPDDELVRAMMPVPKAVGEQAIFIEDTPENFAYVKNLQRLSTTTGQHPVWYAYSKLPDHLGLTNIAPMVVFGYNQFTQQTLSNIIAAAFHSQRQMIYIGPKHAILRPEMKRVEIKPRDISMLPLEQMGAWKLRQRMLGHDN